MNSPKNMGNKAEIVIISEFIKNDIPISIPFGQNEPYDLVIKTKHGFKSVQIKHGTYRNGCVVADIRHRTGFSKISYSTYDGKVDYIAIWCEELNACYLLDINECNGKTMLSLRIDNPKNNSCISTIYGLRIMSLLTKYFYLNKSFRGRGFKSHSCNSRK